MKFYWTHAQAFTQRLVLLSRCNGNAEELQRQVRAPRTQTLTVWPFAKTRLTASSV